MRALPQLGLPLGYVHLFLIVSGLPITIFTYLDLGTGNNRGTVTPGTSTSTFTRLQLRQTAIFTFYNCLMVLSAAKILRNILLLEVILLNCIVKM